MIPLFLSSKDRHELDRLSSEAADPRALRRAQAWRWLEEEESVAEIAERLQVSRQTIYNGGARLSTRGGRGLEAILRDAPRSGRPPTVQGLIDPVIDPVIDEDPRDLGYQATVWPAPLLRHHLRAVYQIVASRQSVSLALPRLRARWKRPRHP